MQDVPAVVWLEDYLLEYKNTLVVVSHDRRFLNTVTTDIIHLNNRKLEYYKARDCRIHWGFIYLRITVVSHCTALQGNYDQFEQTRAERSRHHAKAVESADAKRAHMQECANTTGFVFL
jgi:ATPase subunit of ABC transporter with duplicated ATPase domains